MNGKKNADDVGERTELVVRLDAGLVVGARIAMTVADPPFGDMGLVLTAKTCGSRKKRVRNA